MTVEEESITISTDQSIECSHLDRGEASNIPWRNVLGLNRSVMSRMWRVASEVHNIMCKTQE